MYTELKDLLLVNLSAFARLPTLGALCDQCPVGAINVGTVDRTRMLHLQDTPICGLFAVSSCRVTTPKLPALQISLLLVPTPIQPGFLSLLPQDVRQRARWQCQRRIVRSRRSHVLAQQMVLLFTVTSVLKAMPALTAVLTAFTGTDCGSVVPKCAAALDYGAKLKENELPTGFGSSRSRRMLYPR